MSWWVAKDLAHSSYRRDASRPVDAILQAVMVVVMVTAAPAATAAEAVAVAIISRRLRNARIGSGRQRRQSSCTDSDDGDADRGHDEGDHLVQVDGTGREKPILETTRL